MWKEIQTIPFTFLLNIMIIDAVLSKYGPRIMVKILFILLNSLCMEDNQTIPSNTTRISREILYKF